MPLVAHRGPVGWKCSTEFIDLFGNAPEALRPYLTSFRHALVDLAAIQESTLSADIRLDAYLKAVKQPLTEVRGFILRRKQTLQNSPNMPEPYTGALALGPTYFSVGLHGLWIVPSTSTSSAVLLRRASLRQRAPDIWSYATMRRWG